MTISFQKLKPHKSRKKSSISYTELGGRTYLYRVDYTLFINVFKIYRRNKLPPEIFSWINELRYLLTLSYFFVED